MRVLLTGATGLVGSHVAERLVQEGGEVVALQRLGADTRWLASLGVPVAVGDVRDPPDALARAAEGCTHVVHAAGLVYAGSSWSEIRSVNVGGTRNVLEAAALAGVAHAVHVSSVAVYGPPAPGVDDGTPLGDLPPPAHAYGRSKREAETAAREVASARGLRLTVLRPAAVYGERDRLMAPRIARLTRWPVAFTLGSGRNTIPTVYAGNVADAAWIALRAERDAATYDVGMDHPLTQRALLEGIARGMGRTPRVVPVPAFLVRAGAAVLGALRVPTPGAPGLPLGRVVALGLADNPYRSERIRRELGWRPPHRHEDALVRTGAWLKEATGRSAA